MLSAWHFLARRAHGQSAETPRPVKAGRFNCSPAPCVLPPTQASEGGNPVTNTPIVTNPLNPEHLLLGSVDGNCQPPSVLGFHLSRDGGSTWKRTCMTSIITQQRVYWPSFEPSVGYDRKGAACVVGFYNASDSKDGLVAFQRSTDGIHWSKPAVALRQPGVTFPFETWYTVDTNASSPRVNSLYVSGVMWTDRGYKNQVQVSHSTDGGVTWNQVAVDAVQNSPAIDRFTRMAVGKDGTVNLTWMHCVGSSSEICRNNAADMMFSKSADGGNTWSSPHLITTVTMAPGWQLPNTKARVYNYPVIGIDNSKRTHAGNLYVAMYTWTGTYLRVQVIRSSDGGTIWSKPVPLAPASDTRDQFFPALSVNEAGLVGVSWLDRRNDPANIDYQAFAAVSTDGGQTFPNTQLAQAFSNPNTNGGNNWMGDYTGNTFAGNDFIAAWMDSSNGVDMQEVVGGIRFK